MLTVHSRREHGAHYNYYVALWVSSRLIDRYIACDSTKVDIMLSGFMIV